jgi:glycosyltransferase involved in cell wall biosynthesis
VNAADSPEGLVSVVMPMHDAERYLVEAIESVRAQHHPRWELLLVDDGSRDSSGAIARRYADAEPERIRLLRHPDGRSHGASASRNLGLREARGEFIAFLDADDVWLPENLAEQVPRLQAEPEVGVLYSRTLYWHSWREPAAQRDYMPRLHVPAGRLIAPPEFLIRCVQGKASVPCTCSILLRRSVVADAGGFEPDFPKLYDDQVFYSKLFLLTAVLPVEGCWSRYRRHQASMTMRAASSRTFRESRRAYLTWLQQYVRRSPAAAAALAPTLRRELWRCRHPVADYLLDRAEFLARRVGWGRR